MEGLIILGVVAILVIVFFIIKAINNKRIKITKEFSKLFMEIEALNKKFPFHKISSAQLKFNPTFKSKRSLDNLDFYKFMEKEIECSQDYYATLFDNVDENIKDFQNYNLEYKKIEKYTTEEDFTKIKEIKLKYKTFNKCEKKIYQNSKLRQPIIEITAHCHATYTSPSGRNHYWRDTEYSFSQLKNILKNLEHSQKMANIAREQKEKLAQERREKEKKLRDLNKLEVRLSQKEKEINAKEKEFIEATKEHIYTADKVDIQKQDIQIDENLSLTQKLKLLRTKFDNGEITYEEYQSKRKELM